eukprot:CAMPEP_0198276946 /NCGR_PEP_ID=MMETSP1447-20131203/65586_1 /TAXON_ID=420782 /ORGANISM="Chaetoceros dichaeta, Strain CCMP1751" /LENGTH=783 /DNA_ID=CAMNT_0043971933 /DNA_START=345 /DNA_END=2693 /DNA_ORIENTATION=-
MSWTSSVKRSMKKKKAKKDELKTTFLLDLFDLEIEESDRKISKKKFSNRDKLCNVTIERKGKKERRQIIFANSDDLKEFCRLITQYKMESILSQRERFEKLVQCDDFRKMSQERCIPVDYESFSKHSVQFLIEIVGAEDLLANPSSYVEVRLFDEVVHKTKTISHEPDPVWTLRTKSYFILTISANKILRCTNGLHFIVYDDIKLKRDKILGSTCIPITSLYVANESRTEYSLHPYMMSQKPEGDHAGKLAIRCRHATAHDVDFMQEYLKVTKDGFSHLAKGIPRSIYNEISTLASVDSLIKTRTRYIQIDGERTRLNRVRPCPDPDPERFDSTEWMHPDLIAAEMMKPSTSWIDNGTGSLARIYLEILQCDNLPNTDYGKIKESNKTDPFVQIVYEDCTTQTCVITDCLSPKWLPWTDRAFVLHMLHPSSQISLGVFDYDIASDNDFIGKVSVNLTNLRPETEYVLDYNILKTFMRGEQEIVATMKIRVRIEVDDQRAVALASLLPPPDVYINSARKKEFRSVSNAVDGAVDLNEYKIENVLELVNEILSYIKCQQYIYVAFRDLIMWNSAYQFDILVPTFFVNYLPTYVQPSLETKARYISLSKVTVPLPIDSFVVFICSIALVENPALLPSYFFFFCGWALITVLNWRRNHPNPWYRTLSFQESLRCLVTGEALEPEHSITPHENVVCIDDFNSLWKERFKSANDIAALRAERMRKQRQEIADEMEEFGDLTTQKSTFILNHINPVYQTMNLLKPLIHPYQQQLLLACEWLRFLRNVVIW